MKNRYEVYAVRMANQNVFAVKTELPDVISIERMKSLIAVDGFEFFINVNGKEHDFKFNGDIISEPSKNLLNQIGKF